MRARAGGRASVSCSPVAFSLTLRSVCVRCAPPSPLLLLPLRPAEKHHIYLLSNGRISMCGINSRNIEYLAKAINDVVVNVKA